MSTVFITVGIPASGKTTWARQRALEDDNTTIVCRDDIRLAMGMRTGVDENKVTRIHRAQIEAALLEGMDVIVADTNINRTFRNRLIKFAHEHGADVELVPFWIKLDEAILRDSRRGDLSVGPDVVRKFYDMLRGSDIDMERVTKIPCPRYSDYSHADDRKDAVIVDIDGTLAHMNGRNPYDEARVSEDTFDQTVADTISGLAIFRKAEIVVVSGRTEAAMQDTRYWLNRHGFYFDAIYMRQKGDQRPDYVVKNEIYDRDIIPFWNVLAVFDDRDQVVRHLRARGIKVFQVAPGRF